MDIFNKGGYEVIIYSTQKPKDAYEKAKEYESKVDLIVCSGGDGTLDEVVTGVMEKRVPFPSDTFRQEVPTTLQTVSLCRKA